MSRRVVQNFFPLQGILPSADSEQIRLQSNPLKILKKTSH